MADTKKVFGIKIILTDNGAPVTANSNIGLYNVISNLSVNANAGQPDVTVVDGTKFAVGEVVTVTDTNNSEVGYIESNAGNVLTLSENLTNSYTTAASGKVNGNSVFGWIQNDISGLSGNWKSGIIAKNGINKFGRAIELIRGGNTAQSTTSGVSIKNTSLFWNSIKDIDVYINGLRVEIYEFQNTTPIRRWSGKCEQPTWNAKTYNIRFKSFHSSRITNATKRINNTDYPNASGDLLDQPIPVTIGEIKPVFDDNDNVGYNGYAKFIRTADNIDTFKIEGSNEIGDYTLQGDPTDLSVFPIVGNDGENPTKVYKAKIGLTGLQWYQGATLLTSGSYPMSFFDDYYFHIVEGEQSDQYSKISDVYVDIDNDPTLLVATVNDYFKANLAGNGTATATDNSWLSLDKINRDYQVDIWPCKNYISNTGVSLTNGTELYAYDSARSAKFDVSGSAETVQTDVDETPIQFLRLPQYAYEDSQSGNNNILQIDVKLFDGSPDKMDSFLVLPVSDPVLSGETGATIQSNWSIGGATTLVKVENGVYSSSPGSIVVNSKSGTVDNLIDKDIDTNLSYDLSGTNSRLVFIITANMPDFPKNFRFDNVYFCVKSSATNADRLQTFQILKWRRFIGSPRGILEQNWLGNADVFIDNILDEYYTTNPLTSNRGFYSDGKYTISGDNYYFGYYNTELSNINTEDLYNSVKELAFVFESVEGLSRDEVYTVYELVVLFRKSISIKKAIYSPFQGRIFNDTWESRKTATDLIETPLEALEHFNRLQYYDDSPIPSEGWGLGYASGAKIKTGATANGSFDNTDDTNFVILNTYKAANQLLKYEECSTEKIKKSLCRNYHLASWVDKDGFECVKRVVNSEVTPTDTITFSDIIDRSKIEIKERNPMDIFPEPFVRFRKNFASGGFEDIIRITNVDQASYQSGYVQGIEDGVEAEELWTKCNTLFQKTKILNKPPSDLTDAQWFNGEDAYTRAKEYLENWIDWMYNPTCKINVHYNKAGDWEEAHRFILQLPHQTNDVQIECILTKITVNPNPPYDVDIEAIMLSEDIPESFYIKDTWTNFGNSNDWKDTFTLQGGNDDIKDSM